MENYLNAIVINQESICPKYLQLAQAIASGVEHGHLSAELILPSLSALRLKLKISKNTVEKAYNLLKKQGVIGSVRGKGYYLLPVVQRGFDLEQLLGK